MLLRSGPGCRAMLADFGIAALADEPGLTATGQVVGTLAYMAPEQAAGEPAEEPADVYALCLTLYELWTGANPVAAATPAATVRRIGSAVAPLCDARPELPVELGVLIDAGLDPDPTARPGLTELQAALGDVAGALHPDRAVPIPEGTEAGDPGPPEPRARPFAVLLAGAGLCALGFLAGLPGLALILALLLAPAALLLSHPREWLAPAAAPVLGVAGLAPLFVVHAARHRRPAARASLAALAWAWTAVAVTAFGLGTGMGASGWEGSIAIAAGEVLLPLLGSELLATGLIWVGFAVLLGLLLDVAGPALIAVGGMVWAAALLATTAAVGGPAAPGLLLTPALILALAFLAWDRAGRPLPPAREPAAAEPAPPSRRWSHPASPRDRTELATRAAARHVDAALYGSRPRRPAPARTRRLTRGAEL